MNLIFRVQNPRPKKQRKGMRKSQLRVNLQIILVKQFTSEVKLLFNLLCILLCFLLNFGFYDIQKILCFCKHGYPFINLKKFKSVFYLRYFNLLPLCYEHLDWNTLTKRFSFRKSSLKEKISVQRCLKFCCKHIQGVSSLLLVGLTFYFFMTF